LAIYKWCYPYPTPELTYYISSTRVPILQSGKLDHFTVTYYGNKITNDLSSAEIQIWNAGKQSITREDILKKLTLRTKNDAPIYKTIVTETRDVIGFQWITSSNAIDNARPLINTVLTI
jgi:hypothetical protein